MSRAAPASLRLMGVEREYAVAGLLPDGSAVEPGRIAQEMWQTLLRTLPHLTSPAGGVFLSNGGRFYIDSGNHPELCTPECSDPWEVVRQVEAGDRLMESLAWELRGRSPGLRVFVSRANVDHENLTSWGFHENYQHHAGIGSLLHGIAAHLATRIVFAGSGGLVPGAAGIQFTLSPRAAFLDTLVSPGSQRSRGLVHTKEEPLGRGYRRFHALAADGLCSQTALWLTIASTALVLALIDAGRLPPDEVRLADACASLHVFAEDPALRAREPMFAGPPASALEIQRRLMRTASRYRDAEFMPAWAPVACEVWRRVLDGLAGAPGAPDVAPALDWTIKRQVYSERLKRYGLDWDDLDRVNRALEATDGRGAQRSRIPRRRRRITDAPGSRPTIDAVLACRQELLELEVRFAALGRDGIFTGLDDAGVLAHALFPVADTRGALWHGPRHGRGRLRAACVRRLQPSRESCECNWDRIVDHDSRLWLDLSDPATEVENWQPLSCEEETAIDLEGLTIEDESIPF